MGRLSDNILAVFGIKPSDRVQTDSKQPESVGVGQSAAVQSGDSSFPMLQTGEKDRELSDCLSCKVIGTATMAVTSSFVFYYTFKKARLNTGKRKFAIYGQGLCIGTVLVLLAISRAFDIGPFDQRKKDIVIADQVKSELTVALDWLTAKKTNGSDK